jgi:TonB family protein
MLEHDAVNETAYRRSNQQSLALYIAVSIALHAVIAALFLPWALRHSSREEIVEVFVIGEGGGPAGTKGAPGKAGEPPAGTKPDMALQAEKRALAGDVNKALSESRLELSRVLEAKLKKDRIIHNERVNQATESALTLETLQKPVAGQPAAEGRAVASSGANGQGVDGSGGKGAAGSGIGSGAPFGTAGSGIGTGRGGTGVIAFGSADAPKFLHRIVPQYPPAARMRREEGRVMLKLTIDEKGTLMNVEVVESTGADFADAAVDAAKRSRFTPARRNNAPILSVALLPIRFTLR